MWELSRVIDLQSKDADEAGWGGREEVMVQAGAHKQIRQNNICTGGGGALLGEGPKP